MDHLGTSTQFTPGLIRMQLKFSVPPNLQIKHRTPSKLLLFACLDRCLPVRSSHPLCKKTRKDRWSVCSGEYPIFLSRTIHEFSPRTALRVVLGGSTVQCMLRSMAFNGTWTDFDSHEPLRYLTSRPTSFSLCERGLSLVEHKFLDILTAGSLATE